MKNKSQPQSQRQFLNYFLKKELVISPAWQNKLSKKIDICLATPDNPWSFYKGTGLQIIGYQIQKKLKTKVDFGFNTYPDISLGNEPLLSLLEKKPIKDFAILGLSLSNAAIFPEFFDFLKKAQIPILAKNRLGPIIIAGGLGVVNPLPLAPFVDVFVIGDGDDVIIEILKKYRAQETKKKFLKKISQLPGVYVPGYTPTNKKISFQRLGELKNYRRASLFNNKKSGFIIIDYSCRYKCAFCLFSNTRGHYRYEEPREIKRYLLEMDRLKLPTAILSSASSSNYPTEKLADIFHWARNNLKYTKPVIRSFRIDQYAKMAEFLDQDYLHIAPETGSDRLRNKILKKGLTNKMILNNLAIGIGRGIKEVRLYSIIGLPTETKKERLSLVVLTKGIADLLIKQHGQGKIEIYIHPLLPQPGTPLAEAEMISPEKFQTYCQEIKQELRKKMPKKIEVVLAPQVSPTEHLIQLLATSGDETAGLLLYQAFQENKKLSTLKNKLANKSIEKEFIKPARKKLKRFILC